MSVNGHCFVEWKEEFVSQERGNRVVHYFLKDSNGESILAVIGTERSLRHMFYVVAEEYLQVCGTENSIHAGFKWRSRREVVDWLTSMLSKQYLPGDRSKSPRKDSKQLFGSPKVSESGSGARRTHIPDYNGGLASNVKGQSSDIIWSGAGWKCGKQLKHYPSFCRNGTTIEIQSFVFIMAKEEDHYLAHLEDMYEDRKGQKKVKVRWFHHNQEVKGVIPLRNLHPKEVFITPYVQVISAECVDGPAIVLTPEHYEKCLASFPPALLGRVHLCFRQFRSNRVKPFDLSKLRGYLDQAIFSFLDHNSFSKPNSTCRSMAEEEDEDYSPGDNVKKGLKRSRGCKGRQRFLTDRSGARLSGKGRQILTCEPPLRYGFPSRNLLSFRSAESHPWNPPLFMLDEKIEVLCLDSGIRGCWFRCTVLQLSQKQIKVQYDDLQDEDGGGNLEEWIPACKQALPDKLGMRCLGRPTMRPFPPSNQQDIALQIGDSVDAWWSDGWWEGVVIGVDNNGDDCLHVYFPGENIYLNIQKKNLRISKDWVGDQWIDIEAKPDILSAITRATSPDTKNSASSTINMGVKCNGFVMSYPEIPTNSKLNIVEEEHNTSPLASSDGLEEEMGQISNKKQPLLNEETIGDQPSLNEETIGDQPSLNEETIGDQPSLNEENIGVHIKDSQDMNIVEDDHGRNDDDDNNDEKEYDGDDADGFDKCDNGGTLCMEFEANVQTRDAVEPMEVAA